MPYKFYFEKLEVWKDSIELTKMVYSITKDFPSEEKFGLISQLRRAAVSVSSNIAEGSARNTAKDKSNFMGIAYSSLMEILNLLIISRELGYLTESDLVSCRENVEKVSNKLNAFRKSINS